MLKFIVDKYPLRKKASNEGWSPALGVELTWTQGLGVGVGLGLVDFWVGWPKKQESLHDEGCSHGSFAKVG